MARSAKQEPTGAEADETVSEGMGDRRISRRLVLRTGTLGAAAAGVAAAVPGLSGFLQTASSAAPAAAPEVAADASEAAPILDGPIVAHITDAATGQVSLYFGEQEVATRDPALVQRLLQLAR